jgi:hypothetical protein
VRNSYSPRHQIRANLKCCLDRSDQSRGQGLGVTPLIKMFDRAHVNQHGATDFLASRVMRWRFFCSSSMSLSFFFSSFSVASNSRGWSGRLSELNLAMLDFARGFSLSFFSPILPGSVFAESGGALKLLLFSTSYPLPVLLDSDKVEYLWGSPGVANTFAFVWIWPDILALVILDCLVCDILWRDAIVTYLCLATTALK